MIEQGFLSEAVVNYVALLGWSPEENREIFSLQELKCLPGDTLSTYPLKTQAIS